MRNYRLKFAAAMDGPYSPLGLSAIGRSLCACSGLLSFASSGVIDWTSEQD
jgi:hypothetical protein